MRFLGESVAIQQFARVAVGSCALACIGLSAGAQTQDQQLIPVRGVPFRGLPQAAPQQPVAVQPAQAHQQGRQPLATPQPQPGNLQQPLSQQPLTVSPQKSASTQQPASLLPSGVAARQAAAVAASVVPPERASAEITTIAGEYSYGNGFNLNCILEISPDGRFLYKQCDCDDVVDQAAGLVKLDNGQLMLEPARQRQSWPRGTAPVLIPVTWGQRLYLVPENDMLGFVNEVNRGIEPVSRGSMGNYYLREGDWDRPVSGQPELPEQWKRLLLKEPLQGQVAGKDPTGRWIINLGKEHGVYDNMELSAWSANRRQFANIRVTETGTDTSAVELLDAPPNLSIQGWSVYSRLAPPVVAKQK